MQQQQQDLQHHQQQLQQQPLSAQLPFGQTQAKPHHQKQQQQKQQQLQQQQEQQHQKQKQHEQQQQQHPYEKPKFLPSKPSTCQEEEEETRNLATNTYKNKPEMSVPDEPDQSAACAGERIHSEQTDVTQMTGISELDNKTDHDDDNQKPCDTATITAQPTNIGKIN